MNTVKVGGIYKASMINNKRKSGDDQIIVKSDGAFLDDISIFVKDSGLEVGDMFRILEITEHCKTTKKTYKGYYAYSSITARIEKVDENGKLLEEEQKEKW